jgi:uncharacterized protein YgiM (DUF1202 family)
MKKLQHKLHLFALVGLALLVAMMGIFTATITVQAESTPTATPKPRVIVNVYALNMRTGPGAQYAIITKLSGGSEFPIVGQNKNASWVLIETGVGKGWVNLIHVITRDYFRNAPFVETTSTEFAATVTAGAGALRKGPSLDAEKIGTIVRRTEVTIIGQSEDGAWWLVKTKDQQGLADLSS